MRLAAGRLEIGEPQPLFLLQLGMSGEIQFPRHPYDVSPDGQRFLVIRRAPDTERRRRGRRHELDRGVEESPVTADC